MNIKKVQSHLLLTKFPLVSFIESFGLPDITSPSLRGIESLLQRVMGKREQEGGGVGVGGPHLYKELQLPVVQEMDLTSPPLCHL